MTPSKVDDYPSIPDAFYGLAAANLDATVYAQAVASSADGEPRSWKIARYREVQLRINRLAQFLLTLGAGNGARTGIIMATRGEWMEADIAILSAGGVSVSMYPSLIPSELAYILFDSGAEIVIAENREQVDKLQVIMGSEFTIPGTEDRPGLTSRISLKRIIAVEEVEPHPLVTQWQSILTGGDPGRPRLDHAVAQNDLAALVYTSGTTGPPKGVMQTHRNHLANVRQAVQGGFVQQDSDVCLVLPLSHSFGKLMGYVGFLTPAVLYFPSVSSKTSSKAVPASMAKDIREANAEIFPLVPRLLEKMREGVLSEKEKPGARGLLLRLTLWAADQLFRAEKERQRRPLLAATVHAGLAEVRNKIRRRLFGNNFLYAISGGAKLSANVHEFFESLEMEILEGYGLTETCVATNITKSGVRKIGSVGPVLSDDIEMRIAEDGEILFRGPNVTQGYYQRPTATKASWDAAGWFHTGDLGSIDEEGWLTIIGRKKELIVTSGGKKVAPYDIEAKIKGCSLVSHAVLVGDGRKFCSAVITLDEEKAGAWLQLKGIPSREDPRARDTIYEEVWKHIQNINRELASYETVKKILLADEDLSVDNGLLTPSLKVKRAAVEQRYAAKIDALYTSAVST